MLDLLHVIAETLRINIVLPPGELPLLDVVVRRAPADAVLDRIAAVSGFDIRRAGNTFFLVPHGTTPAAPIPTHLKGKTVTIDANDASASDALRAITALVPLDVHVACDAGTKLHLRLRRLPADLATYAIAFASGLALEHGAPACPMEPTPAEPPPTTARLAIVAEAGIERVALFEDHATRYLVEPIAKVIEIGDGWVAYREPGLQREFQIHPPEVGEPGAWLRDSWRLMATVIDDAPVGLTELPDATWHTVSENRMPDATLIIDPGHLTVTLPNGFRSERHLERR